MGTTLQIARCRAPGGLGREIADKIGVSLAINSNAQNAPWNRSAGSPLGRNMPRKDASDLSVYGDPSESREDVKLGT
jgi:hypothetical protein